MGLREVQEVRMLAFDRMRKADLIEQVARKSGVPPCAAADQVDKAVHAILRSLRNGRTARLPGLGTITPGKFLIFHQERESGKE
jgi:nucleoid DNA-binding protein